MRFIRYLAVMAVLAIAVVVAGCGSSDKSSGASTSSSSGGSKELSAKVDKDVTAAMADQTNKPPSSGPKAEAGKKIVVIPCSMAAEGCARPARAAMAAIKDIGWQGTLIDPAGDPTKMADALRQAISLKADGVILQAIDAQTVAGPLKQAKDAGLKAVAFASVNQGGLYDQLIPSEQEFEDQGYLMGEALYKESGGKPEIVMMTGDEFGVVRKRVDGTQRFIDECGGDCKLLTKKNFLVTTLTTTLPNQTVDIVRQNPTMNVLWGGYDAGVNFMIQGLKQAGLTQKGFAVGFDANVANLDIIRQGGFQKYTVGSPMQWIGYAQIDSLNRQFAGQKVVDEGVKSKLLSKDNAPASGAWEGDADVRPVYKQIWGK
jgi:ribose transport system substrate-binding protein